MHAMIRLVAYIYASLPLEKKLTESNGSDFGGGDNQAMCSSGLVDIMIMSCGYLSETQAFNTCARG